MHVRTASLSGYLANRHNHSLSVLYVHGSMHGGFISRQRGTLATGKRPKKRTHSTQTGHTVTATVYLFNGHTVTVTGYLFNGHTVTVTGYLFWQRIV
jgi:hypothetical protein